MFEQLLSSRSLHHLVPFVKQWCVGTSRFKCFDDNGQAHAILQADGGRQSDALMPALFCLAMHPTLTQTRAALPDGSLAVAYLDDIYIVCHRENAQMCLDTTRQILRDVCQIDVRCGK